MDLRNNKFMLENAGEICSVFNKVCNSYWEATYNVIMIKIKDQMLRYLIQILFKFCFFELFSWKKNLSQYTYISYIYQNNEHLNFIPPFVIYPWIKCKTSSKLPQGERLSNSDQIFISFMVSGFWLWQILKIITKIITTDW